VLFVGGSFFYRAREDKVQLSSSCGDGRPSRTDLQYF
jgi:hypothetical protein